MTRAELLGFLRAHRLAVEATADPSGAVEAAVIGIAVSDTFEIVFDTLSTSRKARNLERNARIALVIGGVLEGEERRHSPSNRFANATNRGSSCSGANRGSIRRYASTVERSS
jgi:hypothetical protein